MNLRNRALTCALVSLACLGAGVLLQPSTEGQAVREGAKAAKLPQPDWTSVLASTTIALPEPQDKVVWRDDLDKALAEAAASKRPLFVTLRCIPCKQCADFDKDVLETGDELAPLLKHFITVRVTTMRTLDDRIFKWQQYQDLDLSWWGYLLGPDLTFYGVYGGMDITGDSSRISIAGLKQTLQRVLDHHYHPKRSEWQEKQWFDGAPTLKGDAQTPKQHAGWKSWAEHGAKEVDDNECLHCHQVAEVTRQPAIDAGNFSKKTDFYVWPYPENLGLKLERDHGLRIKEVTKNSPAAKAGVKVGDTVVGSDRTRFFSEADLRVLLNALPMTGKTEFPLVWQRDGKVMQADLKLSKEWRHYDLGWRKSVAEADIGAAPGIPWPLKASDKERKQLGIEAGKMCVKPWLPPQVTAENNIALAAGLKRNEYIIGVGGESPDVFGRAFMVWFRLNHEPGDKISLNVIDPKGNKRDVSYTLPERKKGKAKE